MKFINILTGALAMSVFTLSASPNDCDIHLMVAPVEQGEDVPAESNSALMSRLENAITASGVTADSNYGQFFVTGRFDHIYYDVLPGPPMQHAMHSDLTLYIGDVVGHKVFASTTFNLRGVGTSQQRAFINAMSYISKNNNKLERFIDEAKDKIIAYYDSHYRQLLTEAASAAATHEYEKALYLTTQIPSCCTGYSQAVDATKKYFKAYVDEQGRALLIAAKGEWAKAPDASCVDAAWAYLMQIDPSSSAYPEAEKLVNEILATSKDDKRFETREKYHDSVNTERRIIDAARQVGVAYGNGQQPVTTNITWLR